MLPSNEWWDHWSVERWWCRQVAACVHFIPRNSDLMSHFLAEGKTM